MKYVQACIDCALGQAERTYNLAIKRRGEDPIVLSDQPKLLSEVRDILSTAPDGVSPAEVSYFAINWAMEKAGDMDPYSDLRQESNVHALSHFEHLKEMTDQSEDPFKTALLLSVAGNIIDLGIQKEYDLDTTLHQAMQKGFVLDQAEDLREALARAGRLLYCCDNAGEIVFDRILIETIRSMHPDLAITAVVNTGGVLNDALMEDARFVGLDQVVPVIETGYNQLGMVVEALSDECREAYRSADLIISKGQANYESLEHRPENIFCILMAKCPIVADYLGVEFKDMVLTRGTGRRSESDESDRSVRLISTGH